MGRGGIWGLLLVSGCAGATTVPPAQTADAPSHRFVDVDHGFEIERPFGDHWRFSEGREAPEGILIPVMVLHADSGAQVVVQIAPSVAPAGEFAERLAVGLRAKHGFRTTTPRSYGDTAADFRFTVDDQVFGRVGIRSEEERTFVLLGTWPKSAPEKVVAELEGIMASLRPVIVPARAYASAP